MLDNLHRKQARASIPGPGRLRLELGSLDKINSQLRLKRARV
jgi:hypothetical protein